MGKKNINFALLVHIKITLKQNVVGNVTFCSFEGKAHNLTIEFVLFHDF